MDEEQISKVLDTIAANFRGSQRAPVIGTPGDLGLAYEDVTFPASDGVPLEGWFLPAASDKLVIANHPMGFTRTGLPSHLDPWCSIWAPSGNNIEIPFMPDYQILHDAGYNVLTYDLRNHGFSGSANGGITSSGIYEARDVIGSLTYARTRPDTSSMRISLFSRCLGANATFAAAYQDPAAFEGIDSLVAAQPVTTKVIMTHQLGLMGIPAVRVDELDRRIQLVTGLGFDAQDPVPWAGAVSVPTFIYQIRDDNLVTPHDVQSMYDAMPTKDKHLHWIEGSKRRWDGYLQFQRNPRPMLDWIIQHTA
ncbi:alpha/beta hydrolase [Micromonospora inyonensis]|uniref:Alpha/beta hydrolase family protein n=1 Tax=Micromonospora inyonensis TaxID=47866 RepID=A0A1C6S0S5_9ACTN|nr:alpha/beta hydrolase [Micromonospora inyonensis]SCL23099.1 Alpha/beta hydrolase family protein [Micromonospora inyonensis]